MNFMLIAFLAVVTTMTACGGGGGGDATQNSAPQANAGANQSVLAGSVVSLTGSASSDADGDALTYDWAMTSKPSGSVAVLASANGSTSSFTPDLAGPYVATLIVNDGKVNSEPATVSITAQNATPIANAGASRQEPAGSRVRLVGTGSSDANGDVLTYRWTLTSKPSGSATVLSSAVVSIPTIVPDIPGTYVASLVVNDGTVDSAPSTTSIAAGLFTLQEQEFNDEKISPNFGVLGTFMAGSLSNAADVDWFVVYVDTQGFVEVDFDVSTNQTGIWNVYLYDGNTVLSGRNIGVPGLKYQFPVSAPGNYYVRVQATPGFYSGGGYRVRLYLQP